MKTTAILLLVAAALSSAVMLTNAHAQTFSIEELERRRVERRAVDAAIWGMPTINFDAMRQAYLRDGEAKYGDIIWWPMPSSIQRNLGRSFWTCHRRWAGEAC
jgi:hypothetical protein